MGIIGPKAKRFLDFDLVPTGRDTYDYTEGDHVIEIYAERMGKEFDRLLAPPTHTHWNPPHDREAISNEKRKQILDRICMYFDAANISYRIG